MKLHLLSPARRPVQVTQDLASFWTNTYEEVKKETTATWAGYGLAFAVVAALAAVSLGARWP